MIAPLLAQKSMTAAAIGLGATVPALADFGFTGTITTGSILVGLLVIMLGGIKTFYKRGYEERGEEIKFIKAAQERVASEHALFQEEQRDLRHQLKDERDSLKGQLELEKAKTDLTAVVEQMHAGFEEILASLVSPDLLTEMIEVKQALSSQTPLLAEIAASLKER